MTTIVTRAGKGSPLTYTEMDANFTNLNQLDTDKAPKANPTFTGTVSGVTATMVANTPAGNIAATTVQSALNELDVEKPGYNRLHNSDMLFARRGTSAVKTSSGYVLDRWSFVVDGTCNVTVAQSALSPGEIPGYRFSYAQYYTVNSASGQTYMGIGQGIENVRVFDGKTVTVSFWARSTSAISLTPQIKQTFGGGGSGTVTKTGSAIPLTSSWVRYSQTLTLDSIAGKTIGTDSHLAVYLFGPINSTYVVGITGVKFEVGSVATEYEMPDQEISSQQCFRFYEGGSPSLAYNYEAVTVRIGGYVSFKASKMKTPTVTSSLGTPGSISTYGFRVDDLTTTGNWYNPTWTAEAEYSI
jgi:hypothetical protein